VNRRQDKRVPKPRLQAQLYDLIVVLGRQNRCQRERFSTAAHPTASANSHSRLGLFLLTYNRRYEWLGSRVVSVLDSGWLPRTGICSGTVVEYGLPFSQVHPAHYGFLVLTFMRYTNPRIHSLARKTVDCRLTTLASLSHHGRN